MRKSVFKKVLAIIDAIELQGISFESSPIKVYEEIANDYYNLKLSELKHVMEYLKEKHFIKDDKNGIDLTPAATIYSKSNQNSAVEALGLFESYMLDDRIHEFFSKQIRSNEFLTKNEVLEYVDRESLEYMFQTTLFEVEQEKLRFHPKLLKGISDILREYKEKQKPLISCFLTALYTSSIVAHEDLRIDYKNTMEIMNDYKHKEVILSIIPRRGIPHDRDETKALQVFYKDTLFHEFAHECPICNINIPHMLIASHIKPFRDCAHIYEAIDHNNGLLLCRNHDYLFDQGFITFDDHGYIILSRKLMDIEDWEHKFSLRKNYQLPEKLMTEDRVKFLTYHRKHIFIK
ncbi:HNH endonuclease [[Eubacterium] hominis]|uniref:HNH endonuclease n=1 Tax=[Eubacterium] hominis TaxID=2764325 RepID=UPI003A4D869B